MTGLSLLGSEARVHCHLGMPALSAARASNGTFWDFAIASLMSLRIMDERER